jgi:hypothetical protein
MSDYVIAPPVNEYYSRSTAEPTAPKRKGIYREITLHKAKFAYSEFLAQLAITQRMYLRRVRDGHSEIQYGIITLDKYGHASKPQFLDTIELTLKLDEKDYINGQRIEDAAIVGFELGHTGSSTYETADGESRAYKHVDVVESNNAKSQWQVARETLNAVRGKTEADGK